MNPANPSEEIPSAASQENTAPAAEKLSELSPEENSASPVEQTSIKLKLPPKPVLANATAPPIPISTPQEPSPTLSLEAETADFSEKSQEKNSSQKEFLIGRPTAFLFFLIALVALLTQLRFLFQH